MMRKQWTELDQFHSRLSGASTGTALAGSEAVRVTGGERLPSLAAGPSSEALEAETSIAGVIAGAPQGRR